MGPPEHQNALTADQDRALTALLAVVLVGVPQLERALRAHGLLQIEFGLLQALGGRPDGWRLSDLAQVSNMSQSRLSHRMRKLVDLGYVHTCPSQEDGRATIAVITPAGRRLIDDIKPGYLCQARRTLFANLDDEQTRVLADNLTVIAEGIGAYCGEHGGEQDG